MNSLILVFERGALSIEVRSDTWEAITTFLAECGYESDALNIVFQSGRADISAEEASRLAQTAEVILEEAIKDPLNAYSMIRIDMGKFAELATFAAEGGFTIRDLSRNQ